MSTVAALEKPLGLSPVRVAPLGLGVSSWGNRTWGYGVSYGQPEVKGAFEAAQRAGITLFDTAELYGSGESERMLGALARSTPASSLVVATKFAPLVWSRPASYGRFRRRAIREALQGSLDRLGLQKIGLYQLHCQPTPQLPTTPVLFEELASLVREGRVEAIGVSNYGASALRAAHAALARHGVPLASNQIDYSLINRTPETNGVLATCRELKISVIAYHPLAQGLLTGKYVPGEIPAGRVGHVHWFKKTRGRPLSALLGLMRELGQAHGGKTVGQVALNWLLCQEDVFPIVGSKTAEQVNANVGSLGWALTVQERQALEQAAAR
jgi:aryl-alcohol dehydrogenase-like predicted oxidoreductase